MSSVILGLTGGIGSGKTAATDVFESLGIEVVDADVIARKIVSPGSATLNKIVEHFGDSVLTQDGELNRPYLRQLIFTNEEAKQALNGIMHPAIRSQIQLQLQAADSPYVILSAPLLLENGLDALVDDVLVIDVPETLQLQRASSRDKVPASQIENIIQSQISRDDRLAKANFVIDNSQGMTELTQQVNSFHRRYLTKC